MTNGDKIRQMNDEELAEFITEKNTHRCMDNVNDCSSYDNCKDCTLKYLKSEAQSELMESKRDGFFECDMFSCMYHYGEKCTNPCYIDCHYYSIKKSIRELISKYEEIVNKL